MAALALIVLLALGGLAFWLINEPAADVYPEASAQDGWKLNKPAENHQIEGYVSAASVNPGSTLNFHIGCKSGAFSAEIYRMGWYDGEGASRKGRVDPRPCRPETMPEPDRNTGLVNAEWPLNFRLHIPSDWQPGVYLAKLTDKEGYQTYVPFTVRTPKPHNAYLFVHAINTDNAYNTWGGNSLYSGFTPNLNITRAVKVSLNRPFLQYDGKDDGSGDFLTWEYSMVKFLEEYNYKVDYATDIDIQENPSLLQKYKAVILTGHDEYWSKQMRQGYVDALNHDVNLAIFAANTAYRPVRFEPDPLTGRPNRIMVDYKSSLLDPYMNRQDQSETTPGNWHDRPLYKPESEILGIEYRDETENSGGRSADLVVNDDQNWMFHGTGLKNGDTIPGVLGYEYEQFSDAYPHPANVDLVFHSPINSEDHGKDFADASYYQLPRGGAQVFDAGTMEWSWGLDPDRPQYSPVLTRITKNILDRFGL